jgi:hypothetical protein
MRTMERGYLEALSNNPKGAVGLSFLRPGTPVASAEARAEGARFVKDLGMRVPRVAMVVEEGGVAGSAMRTVIRGINIITRNPSLVVCANMAEGIQLLLPVLSQISKVPIDPRELTDVVLKARADWNARATFAAHAS